MINLENQVLITYFDAKSSKYSLRISIAQEYIKRLFSQINKGIIIYIE